MAKPAATASSVSARAQSDPERVVPPRAARPSQVPATAPDIPAKAPPRADASRPVSATPPTAPIASRTAMEGGMRRSGANGILSPAISARAAAVASPRGTGPSGIHPVRVRPCEAAQVKAAQAVMLRIPVTKPIPSDTK